jgi:hypothetical protein
MFIPGDIYFNLNNNYDYISNACKGKMKTYNGYIWKYEKDYINKINNNEN